MAKNYPNLTFENVFDLYNVIQNMRRDPAYLEESPYSDSIRKALKNICIPPGTRPEFVMPSDSIQFDNLDIKTETEYLYAETKMLLKSKLIDEKDRAAIIKTATSQMDKLITLIEKAEDIRNVREFENRVLKAMKKMPQEVREEFIDEIERMEKEDGSES